MANSKSSLCTVQTKITAHNFRNKPKTEPYWSEIYKKERLENHYGKFWTRILISEPFLYLFHNYYRTIILRVVELPFYARMTVHRNRFLVNKTNRRTEIQFHWYYNSTCFGQPFCPSSRVLSRTSALVHFMQFDDRLPPGVGRNCSSILLLVANGHHNCIKCTKTDVRLRTPDDGQKGCPKHVES